MKLSLPKCIFPKCLLSKCDPPNFIFPKCIYPKCIFAKCTRLACLLSFASLFSLKLRKYIFENVKYSQKRQQAFQFYCLQNTHNLKTGQTCILTKIAHQSFPIGNPPEFCHQKSIRNPSEIHRKAHHKLKIQKMKV